MSLAKAVRPTEWNNVICQCLEVLFEVEQTPYPRRIFWDDGTNIFICVRCNKPSDHCIYKCINCSAVFLKDYSHPRWVLDWPKCWTCLESGPDRAAEVILGSKRQPLVKPKLRKLYIHITEGFDADSFFGF